MTVEQLIFTDWPRGKGVDPAASGLQVRACSAGLGAEARKRLATICMHLGQAYTISHAPQTAVTREQEWLTKTDSRKQAPADVLAAFPVIWSYEQLGQELFALIRTHYTCLTHDGRTGNFLAHALVFTPADLDAFAGHPLALQRGSLFDDADATDETVLPSLPRPATAVPPPPTLDILRTSPFSDHLPALATALAAATLSSRPLLICLREWQQAAPLVESLLYLLPPSRRSRTTFSTYESDRTWIVPAAGGRPTGVTTERHLLVLCSPDGRSLNLRADEYQTLFAIFNFAGERFSERPQPGDYATFVARCVADDRLQLLHQHHDLVEKLGLADNLAAWDKLVTAVDLPDDGPDGQWLATAIHNLAALVSHPAAAAVALTAIWPHVETLVAGNQALAIGAAAPALAKLLEMAAKPEFTARIQELAGNALQTGHVQTAVALLKTCGPARERILLALLQEMLSPAATTRTASQTPEDREAWVDLLLEGLRLAEKQPAAAPPSPRLALALFQAAAEAGRSADVWERVGNAVVKPYLDGPWDAEKQTFARNLAAWLSPTACPEGCAWLSMKRVEMTNPQAEEFQSLLAQAASAGARAPMATELMTTVRQMAAARSPDKEMLALTMGRVAEATQDTESGAAMYAAYQESLEPLKPKERNQVRRKLAKIGAHQILCRELLADVLPWEETESPQKYQRWRQVVLQDSPPTLDVLYQQVAHLLLQPGRAEEMMPLVWLLLPGPTDTAVTPGLSALYISLVQILPLAPLPDEWAVRLATIPVNLPPETETRWRMMKFMSQVTERAIQPGWSWAAFPESDPVWQQDLANLPAPARERVMNWFAAIIATTGVTTPQEAQRLVGLLAAAGAKQPADVVAFVSRLLTGRDPVTAVLVVMAFARCVLEVAKPDEVWGQIVGTLLARLDGHTQQLFEAHLNYRFARRDTVYETRLAQLRAAAGLSHAIPEPKPAKTQPATVKQPKQEIFSPITTAFGSATRRLRRFIGEADAQTPEKRGDDE